MNTKENNRFKQECFEAEKKAAGLKAIKLYLSVDDILRAKELFIPKDDIRKNTQREAVTKSFLLGLGRQDDLVQKNSLLQAAEIKLYDIKCQYMDMENGFNRQIEELRLELRCAEINLKNERDYREKHNN